MRVIIAGPRDLWPTKGQVYEAINASPFTPKAIISGDADGVDLAAYNTTRDSNLYIPISVRPRWEFWRAQGNVKVAGPERNEVMAAMAEALIVIRREGERTRGTNSMIKEAEKAGIPIYVYEIED